jgi:cephalosporin hydroxylase
MNGAAAWRTMTGRGAAAPAARPAARPAVETVLIFPAGLPDSLKHRAEAQARGQRVIGASSLNFDPAAQAYDAWEHLPWVHDRSFADRLDEVIRRCGVTAIYAPHEVVSGVLCDLLASTHPGVRLIDPHPAMKAEQAYRDLLAASAEACATGWFGEASKRPLLTPIERAGVVRLVDTVAGMTDGDKIDAVIETLALAPDGDIVEIGSWWGRSAALFVLLAQRWKIGSVLCVDPWRQDNLNQGVEVLDRASARVDTDWAHQIFQINLAPLAGGRLNFMRATSTDAAARYHPGLTLENESFGATTYTGQIAFLHIDGNHTYEHAAADAAAWTPHVMPGGWIVFDDYIWAFGDGPRRVGDEYLAREHARIAVSFVIGTALFVRLRD